MTDLTEELKQIAGLPFEDDRFDNTPYSMMQYPAFKEYLNEQLSEEDCYLEQPPKKGSRGYRDWDTSIGFNAFDLQRHTASVDEHTDDVTKGRYLGLYVVSTKPSPFATRRTRYFDSRAELRYTNQYGVKVRTRLSTGTVLVFNPRMKHELINYGDLTTFALFDVKKVNKQ